MNRSKTAYSSVNGLGPFSETVASICNFLLPSLGKKNKVFWFYPFTSPMGGNIQE